MIERLEDRWLLSVSIFFDYSLDSGGFFTDQARRDVLEEAATQITNRMGDTLDEISASGINNWRAIFTNPSTGVQENVANLVVPADTLYVYVGARDLSGSTLGEAGPGGWSASGTQKWLDKVRGRGELGAIQQPRTDFAPWGGQITFDDQINWHFGLTTSGLDSGESDFLSVAIHELGHIFGVGTADSWDEWVVSGEFTGPAAVAEYDGVGNVPLTPAGSHWANGTTDEGQETSFDPSITSGTRKVLTELDLAGLDDIGWEISQPDVAIDLDDGQAYTIILDDDGVADDGVMRISIDGSWESLSVPTSSLTINGADGNDTITVDGLDGTFSGDLIINGGDGADHITVTSTVSYAVEIHGGNDADTLVGGGGNDELNGGSGADSLDGGQGADLVFGGSDRDTLVGGDGNDSLYGQGGSHDELTGNAGDDRIDGGAGTDRVVESGDTDWTLTPTQLTGSGTDTLVSLEWAVLTGGNSANTLDASAFTGNATLSGGAGNDDLRGGSGDEFLNGADGDDTVIGNGGNDRLIGGAGQDSLVGGDGDDTLDGQGSSLDRLTGGAGDDVLDGGAGTDYLIETGDANLTLSNSSLTGLGSDTLSGLERAILTGGTLGNVLDASAFSGPVSLHGGGGDDELIGGSGDDFLNGADGNDTLRGNAGGDVGFGGAGKDLLIGGAGDDRLWGQGGSRDTVQGGDGDDTLDGGVGHDSLLGEGGNDRLQGRDGNDTMDGGLANDLLNGEAGDDVLRGGDGNDRLQAHEGNDSLTGGHGDDTLLGGSDNDTILGGDGADRVAAGAGNDWINGELGNDTLLGGAGNDSLYGSGGQDVALGEDGDDYVNGQGGSQDTVAGGDGTDTVVGDPSEVDESFTVFSDWAVEV